MQRGSRPLVAMMIEWLHEFRLSIFQAMKHIGLDPLYVIPLGIIAYAATLWRDYLLWFRWWAHSGAQRALSDHDDLSKEDLEWLRTAFFAVMASVLILLHASGAV